MGQLDFHTQGELLVFCKNMLKKRGLRPDFSKAWEIHGPHKGLDYPVIVGYGLLDAASAGLCLAITPNNVYEIPEPILWWYRTGHNRIELIP